MVVFPLKLNSVLYRSRLLLAFIIGSISGLFCRRVPTNVRFLSSSDSANCLLVKKLSAVSLRPCCNGALQFMYNATSQVSFHFFTWLSTSVNTSVEVIVFVESHNQNNFMPYFPGLVRIYWRNLHRPLKGTSC